MGQVEPPGHHGLGSYQDAAASDVQGYRLLTLFGRHSAVQQSARLATASDFYSQVERGQVIGDHTYPYRWRHRA